MTIVPFIGISRLRMKVDGRDITTLVAFHGCPLRCRYCLNAQCFHAEGIRYHLTAEEVMKYHSGTWHSCATRTIRREM